MHQVLTRHLLALVVDAAPADLKYEGFASDAELRGEVDHFLALSNRPALSSASDIGARTVV
jgi:hypothetical protein